VVEKPALCWIAPERAENTEEVVKAQARALFLKRNVTVFLLTGF
jgi:hypothetical protein